MVALLIWQLAEQAVSFVDVAYITKLCSDIVGLSICRLCIKVSLFFMIAVYLYHDRL